MSPFRVDERTSRQRSPFPSLTPVRSDISVDILGDAGEGGATLDYQVGGLLNYQIKPKMDLAGRMEISHCSLRKQWNSLERIDSGYRSRRNLQVQIDVIGFRYHDWPGTAR